MADIDSISPAPSSGPRGKKCGICSRSFARSEHLTRHQRTHTKEKPFSCPHCRRSFQRTDVRTVHLRKCPFAPQDRGGVDGDAVATRRRVRIACSNCRKRKMRCDGKTPCAPCSSMDSVCQYKTPTTSSSTVLSPPMHAGHDEFLDLDEPADIDSQESFQQKDVVASCNELGGPLPSTHNSGGRASPLNDLGTGVNNEFSDRPIESLNDTNDSMSLQEATFPALEPTPMFGTSDISNMPISLTEDNTFYPLPDSNDLLDLWHAPVVNSQFWFDGSDLAMGVSLFDSNSPLLDHVLSSSMQHLTATMQEYFNRKSRAPSPSLSKASKMWYSSPPNLEDHDKDIVQTFTKIFRRHIPHTFSLFSDCTVGRKHRAAYTLAMAAIGGLFCAVPGSAEVARSLYNDARRLLLASFNVPRLFDDLSTTREDKLSVVKTFILLEIYGLCSGDKRSYEFVEVFHGNLIHSIQDYSQACLISGEDGELDRDDSRLLESLYILDCYRIVIMQRPPSLSWQCTGSFALPPPPDSKAAMLQNLLTSLINRRQPGTVAKYDEFSLASLAWLSIYLWPTTYPRQNKSGAENGPGESLSLCKADFFELACDNWLLLMGQNRDYSQHVIYHMMNIMVHANLTVLQSFAHSAPGSTARDPQKSLIAKEVFSWAQDRHYKIAHWHAENMISTIEEALTVSGSRSEQQEPQHIHGRISSASTEPRRLPYETPHVPYAVYYATLVLWCGKFVENAGELSVASAQAQITRGERILSLHKIHIAQLLACVLGEVDTRSRPE